MRIKILLFTLFFAWIWGIPSLSAQEASTFSGLKFRSIGPAKTSGRVADLAVNPNKPSEYYVAAASGGVWKTENNGVTWSSIFDGEGSYSIGCVTLDPNNPNVVWVGSGENNNQRSVAYGDGIYKSVDGGKSWKNMGLKNSEHIGKILVHPENSEIIYVAAQGPLWSAGGERGLYKSTNGGQDWDKVLDIDEHTGVTDIALDPRDPERIYAVSHQRRRRVWTYIGGGPGSALHLSKDGGKSWEKISNGIPKVDLGRMSLAVSPVDPDYIYLMIEAEDGKGGVFRSTDRGGSFHKQNDYFSSGNYYCELIPDPLDRDKLYSMDTYGKYSDDGGKSWKNIGSKHRHVDDHAFWVDPKQPEHFLIGCDGGIYESYDHGQNWIFKANLPITQFYKVALDNAEPFYNVYGGTQDNFSLGGPSRTTNIAGIVNSDWFITKGGDGFESQVDPKDPNIVYAQSQYGWLVRYDKNSGETIGIKPHPQSGEKAYRWNWDAPLLISPHDHKRLYFAANKLFRSDDRGNTWKTVSPDLTRQLDRNTLKVMGRVWSMDAVRKNKSTTIFGNIVALAESPLQEGLLYVGTDDGLIQISEDGGGSWRKVSSFPGVPDMTYVNYLVASQHDKDRVYAVFNNHKSGDFRPYILRSDNRGRSWQAVQSDLPERGSVYCLAEDHEQKDLLFCGTEFGVYFTQNGGQKWVQLKGGLPTVAIRDMEIQKRENDLVLASFGRGFYVLDDYSPLRHATEASLYKEAEIFPIKESLMFIHSKPLGRGGKTFQGEAYYTADNPPVAACFTYHLKEDIPTLKEQRQKREKELFEKGEDIPYPSFEEMRAEDMEEEPALLFTVTDSYGNVVKRLKTKPSKGIHRTYWDFRYESVTPTRLKPPAYNPYAMNDWGPLVLPGTYRVSLSKVINGEVTELVAPVRFETRLLQLNQLAAEDQKALVEFQGKVRDLRRAVEMAGKALDEMQEKVQYFEAAFYKTSGGKEDLASRTRQLKEDLNALKIQLDGDASLAQREFETLPSVSDRVGTIVWYLWHSTSAPTSTQRESWQIASNQFAEIVKGLRKSEADIQSLEADMEKAGAPWTPGRIPDWK